MSRSPAAILYDASGNPVGIEEIRTVYRLQTQDLFAEDRGKIVAANLSKNSISATTYYVLIDLDSSAYKHDNTGTGLYLTGFSGRALKSNVGSQWAVQLAVVLRIDGTDADLGILPGGSVSLRDTSTLSGGGSLSLFPGYDNLTVSGGDFTHIADGTTETNVAAVNTGVTFEDVYGTSVTPAVGDVLLRATLLLGSGTLEFSYGLQYWVE